MIEYLIFKIQNEDFKKESELDSKIEYKIWNPGICSFVPPYFPKKYIIYWLFHFLKVFRNGRYQAVFGYIDGKIVSSFLVVPKYYRWPFMSDGDLQFTFVKTYPSHRRLGIGYRSIQFGLSEFLSDKTSVWYVTDDSNQASVALAQKCGFSFYCNGKRDYLFGLKFLKILRRK